MKNKLSDISLKGWKNLTRGIVTIESPVLIGMIYNPVDYVIDGYTFINRTKIKSVKSIDDSMRQRIMNSKAQTWSNKFDLVHASNFSELFDELKKRGIFCEVYLSKEDLVYIGKTMDVKTDSIDIDFYTTDFKLLDTAFVKFKDIKLVTIYSDYSTTFEDVVTGKL